MSTRPQIIDEVRRRLRRRDAVALVGPAGIGKTYIAARATANSAPLIVQCLRAFEHHSLRPLSHALGTPLHGRVDDVVADVVAALEDRCLVVEDVHWADERTRAVVASLVGRVPCIVTSRTASAIAGIDGAHSIDVPPLTPSEANELADIALGDRRDELGRALLEAAAGNPLLLLNLPHAGRVSPTLRAAVRERLERADPATIEVLTRLALHGRPAPPHWVALPSSVDAEGLVSATSDGRVWFAHDLLMAEVLELVDSGTADAQRRRLIEIGDDSDAARHHLALGELDQAAAIAEAAASGADPSARADLLALAVEARGTDSPARLRLDAADALLAAHRTAEALRIVDADEFGRAAGGDDAQAAAAAAFRRAQALWLDGLIDRAIEQIEIAVAATTGAGTDLEVRAVVERALFLVRVRVGDPSVIGVADHALALARERGVAVARALSVAGLARSHNGQTGWRELFEEASAVAERDDDIEEALAAKFWIVSSLGFYGPMVDADVIGSEMVELTSRLRSLRWYHHFLGANVVHRFGLSRLDAERLAATVSLLEREPDFRNRAQVDLVLVATACDLDRPDDATQALAEGRRHVRNDEDAALMAIAAAEIALQQRDLGAMQHAIDELEAAGRGFFGLNVLMESAAIHLAVDVPFEPIPTFSAALTPTLSVVALERSGYDHLMAGELSAAVTSMRRAAETWADQSMLRFAHRSFLSTAKLALCAGDLDAAAEAFEVACGVAASMCPQPAPARTDALWHTIDRTRSRALLTPREVEILLLVAAGRTTREIANQLGLREATVDSHVGDAMRRLGCATRRQAAARVA